ncbi:Formate dehydrogenase H [Leclercia adecarboxylata]|uniref:Formate dehydrogenase H n=1 Tax=Leclercia adecarboxylata TaxID=83655 RepID=A0A4U9IDZ6_9ENTR|nr:Formate dehydrogenase H [Leclercia adecarboxylata]
MGYPMHYDNTQQIWDELRHLCPDFLGATYEKMGRAGLHPVAVPRRVRGRSGDGLPVRKRVLYPNGLGQLYTCDWVAPIDKLTEEYPLVLSTVREVGQLLVPFE